VCKLGFFWHEWTSLKREWNERFKGLRAKKKAQFTQERVEYKVVLFDELLKGAKSLKTFKISLTFRFDKLWHLSKSAHTGEISQILTVSNKKIFFCWPLVNFNINELFCLKYSELMDLINTPFFINKQFLRFWRFDDILMFALTNTAAGFSIVYFFLNQLSVSKLY
jgi:hypothetical protein